MKVLFTFGGLVHYYNFVLNKLNAIPGLEVIVVTPDKKSVTFGEGVYETKEGTTFKHIQLEEYRMKNNYLAFKNFSAVLKKEKPDIVVVISPYLHSLFYDISVLTAMKRYGIKLILKEHPFRLSRYDEIKILMNAPFINAAKEISQRITNRLKKILGKNRLIELITPILKTITNLYVNLSKCKIKWNVYYELHKKRFFYQFPQAFVCYIEDAVDIFGSYGVKKKKIFITYNSPDTDMLLKIKDFLESEQSAFQKNDHRIIHVGRLVEWKRVDMLIKAFKKVKNIYSDSELLILGYGPEEEKLKMLCADLKIAQDVKFLGGIYDPELMGKYLMSSSVYVLAGMGGLSINDAMCFELPVICSVCDGTEKKLVRDGYNGKYFRDGDEDDLVEKILYLFSNDKLRKEMGKNSNKIIREEINVHTVINGYVKAFEYVTKRKIK